MQCPGFGGWNIIWSTYSEGTALVPRKRNTLFCRQYQTGDWINSTNTDRTVNLNITSRVPDRRAIAGHFWLQNRGFPQPRFKSQTKQPQWLVRNGWDWKSLWHYTQSHNWYTDDNRLNRDFIMINSWIYPLPYHIPHWELGRFSQDIPKSSLREWFTDIPLVGTE